MTSQSKEPEQSSYLSPEQAQELLEALAKQKKEAYNQGMLKLTEQTGCVIIPALLLPGGEVVTLASWLEAHGIKAVPRLKIVLQNG